MCRRSIHHELAILGVLLVSLSVAPPASAMVSPSILREVVRACRPRLVQCASDTPPSSAGRVVVRFTIAPAGNVLEAEVTTNDTGSVALAECVTRVVLDLVFPPNGRGGTIRVNYPFRFELAP